jgi:NADH dehydrogenase
VQVTRGLGAAGVRATLLNRQYDHLFQPLLYQVTTAALSPADIAELVRTMLRRSPNVEVLLEEVTGIDVAARRVALADGKSLSCYILVLAADATDVCLGHDEWAGFAPSLKPNADARRIRSRLVLAFEQAEMSNDRVERKRLMTFAVIGGGPSGVEIAGAIAELARYSPAKDFRRIDTKSTTVILLEAGPRMLSAFSDWREGIARRQSARHADRQERTRKGESRPLRAGTAECLCVGRPRTGSGNRRKASAGARASDQPGMLLSRPGVLRKIRDGAAAPDFEFRNRGNAVITGR